MKLIRDIEARLARARVSVARICREAEKDRTDWQRWKGGRVPRAESWARVRGVLVARLGEEGIPEEFPPLPVPAMDVAAE